MIAVMTFSTFGNAHAGLADMLNNLEKALNEAGNTEVAAAPSAKVSDQSTYNTTDIGPGGIEASCVQISAFETGDAGSIFNIKAPQWTPEMFAFLNEKADSCADEKIKLVPASMRDSQIKIIQAENRKIKKNISIVYAQNQGNEQPPVVAKPSADCYTTNESKLYNSQQALIELNIRLADINRLQNRERKISQESGIRNLARERDIAETKIYYTELRDAEFKKYKELGGKATSADKVIKSEYINPC